MIWTTASIRNEAERRGITRLCHFTPSRNLGHIAENPRGILASQYLRRDEKAVFNPTDSERLDGHPNHVCCSIQYPNAWYFRTARQEEPLFRDWVVVFIRAHYLWRTGTKFCPRNAAAWHGRLIGEGPKAFHQLFAATVEGSGSRTFTRSSNHPEFLPTDEQAEVLILDQIEREDVMGIAVRDDPQARREVAALKLLGRRPPPILVVPQFYDPKALSGLLRAGRVPREREHPIGSD